MLQHMRLQLRWKFRFIQADQCVGLIFGANIKQITGIEPRDTFRDAPGTAASTMMPEKGPERLTSCATLVAVTVEVWFHLSRSVFWAEIWCQFQADYGIEPLRWIQGCSRHCSQHYEARARPGELTSCAALVAVAVAAGFRSSWSVCSMLQALQANIYSQGRARGAGILYCYSSGCSLASFKQVSV